MCRSNFVIMSFLRGLCPPLLWRGLSRVRRACGYGKEYSPLELELARLEKLPLGTPVATSIFGGTFRADDAQAFLEMYKAYFERQTYQFTAKRAAPLIFDGGANVGVGVRYWKSICPDARVVAFEPDPDTFADLRANCASLNGIEYCQAALWVENGNRTFRALGGVQGHLACLCPQADGRNTAVTTVRLRDRLTEPVELLKLDIEGAEVDVLLDCADRLHLVDKVFVEYHSFVGAPQRLRSFFGVLEEAGYRIHALPELPAKRPFMHRPVVNNKDFRLNVFCFRE